MTPRLSLASGAILLMASTAVRGQSAKEWTTINNGLTCPYVSSIAIHPAAIYLGTAEGCFRSLDMGSTWENSTAAAGCAGLTVGDIVVVPDRPELVYFGTFAHGVYKSADGGGTWTPINEGLPTRRVMRLAVHPADPSILFAGPDGKGIYRSLDAGLTWTACGPGKDVRCFAIDLVTPDVLYASTESWVKKTTDGGRTWSLLANGLPVPYVAGLCLAPSEPSVLYAGPSEFGVYKSADAGQSWSWSGAGLPAQTDMRILVVDPLASRIVYGAAYDHGAWRSLDGGETWSAFNEGLEGYSVLTVAVDPSDPSRLYAGTAANGVFVRRSPAHSCFRRGDANADGRHDIADAVFILRTVFGQMSNDCLDASDIDDNGLVDMIDGVCVLGYLFGNGRAPAAPFLSCGADGTADSLDCAGHASCE